MEKTPKEDASLGPFGILTEVEAFFFFFTEMQLHHSFPLKGQF